MKRLLSLLIFFSMTLHAENFCYADSFEMLMRDLMTCECIDAKLARRYPVHFNHLFQGGYFNMPSARMGQDGELGFGYASVSPYRIWSVRSQITNRLELTLNYRVFRGVDDPILTPLGFGDLSDKGANFKFAFVRPEDSDYLLPGVAFGMEDFMGTRNFKGSYIVATQVIEDFGLELSLGYGTQRIRRWFGGVTWTPFWRCDHPLKGLSLSAEYDAIPYHDEEREPHPRGRESHSAINYGVKLRLFDALDLSFSRLRGLKYAFAASLSYNFGQTTGFVPKIEDPLPYRCKPGTAPPTLSFETLSPEFIAAFCMQGFTLHRVYFQEDACLGQVIRMSVYNNKWRLERDVRERLTCLLAHTLPGSTDYVIVEIESLGFPVQEYHFPMDAVRRFARLELCEYELQTLSPLEEIGSDHALCSRWLYYRWREWWNLELLPKSHTFFGSAKGKFKYGLGLSLNLNGYLFNQIYYAASFGWIGLSNLHDLSPVDRLNPSQIINVRSDIVRYYKQTGITFDKLYLQKAWNMGCATYSRIAAGYFEQQYGGVAAEVLYYPIQCPLAVGVEGAFVMKRNPKGLGFTDEIRIYDGFQLNHQRFYGSQYFANFYYDLVGSNLDLKIKAGKFLANDWGARFELSRYFPSGLRLSFWYTRTTGRDFINCERYHDKGIAFSMPLDIFYTRSERSRWGYGIAAWLRDVGAFAETGRTLHEMISDLRQ